MVSDAGADPADPVPCSPIWTASLICFRIIPEDGMDAPELHRPAGGSPGPTPGRLVCRVHMVRDLSLPRGPVALIRNRVQIGH